MQFVVLQFPMILTTENSRSNVLQFPMILTTENSRSNVQLSKDISVRTYFFPVPTSKKTDHR